MEKEYDVYFHRFAGAMADEEAAGTETETAGDAAEPKKEEGALFVQLDGYKTVFDNKVALMPVELVPAGAFK